MSSDVSREELKERLLRVSRKVGSQSALFSQAVAERLGLATTDVEGLDLLLTEGALTVGRLAELTGLTTGSATRMVDRLEQAGFVRRVADPADRRRVLVDVVPGVDVKLHALHDSLRLAEQTALDRYDYDQLQLFADFLEDMGQILFDESVKMRGGPAAEEESEGGGSHVAPVAGITAGRLVFLSGAPRITIQGDASLTELYRAHFVGPVPRMRVRSGVVTVAYPHFAWFDWRGQVAGQNVDVSAHWQKDQGEIVLNARIPWAIELRGGISSWSADLRTIRLEELELRGGASKVEIKLGQPVGIVPIRVHGGMSRISIERPIGCPTGLEIHGLASEIIVDGEQYKGSSLSLQTPGAESSPDRYEIEVSGGVSKMSISSR